MSAAPAVPAPRARTLARDAALRGVGLFTGTAADVTIRPAPRGHGLRFRRVDLPGSPEIAATVANVVADPRRLRLPLPTPLRCTILAAHGAFVITTEHVLSALAGLGVTDAIVEVGGGELPAFDGSAEPFARAMLAAGLTDPEEGHPPLVLRSEIRVGGGDDGTIVATPRTAPGGSRRYELDYGPFAPIPAQAAQWSPGEDYIKRVAPARTFCLAQEAEAMRTAGLFRHLSPRDMLVIGPAGPVDNAYRFADEPARHKLLDLIGDLALVGRPIQADIVARRSGHALNHALARALLAESARRRPPGAT
jgi:UDP-3-O-acyl N-acetylglucosamine deacetylase